MKCTYMTGPCLALGLGLLGVAWHAPTAHGQQNSGRVYSLEIAYRLPDDPSRVPEALRGESDCLDQRTVENARCSNARGEEAREQCRRKAESDFRRCVANKPGLTFWLLYPQVPPGWSSRLLPLTAQQATDPLLDREFRETSTVGSSIGVYAYLSASGRHCAFGLSAGGAGSWPTRAFRAHFDGEHDVCEALLISTKKQDATQALLSASRRGDVSVAQAAAINGALINQSDKHQMTALTYAVHKHRSDFVEYLVGQGADVCLAAWKGDLRTVTVAARVSADVIGRRCGSEQDCYCGAGATPLHAAAAGGHRNTVAWLVEHGADILAKDSAGQAALDVAISKNHGRLASYLRPKTQN